MVLHFERHSRFSSWSENSALVNFLFTVLYVMEESRYVSQYNIASQIGLDYLV